MNATVPPGWYSDPGNSSSLRWWDGTRWTDHCTPVPAAAPGPLPPGVVAPGNVAASPGYAPPPPNYTGPPPNYLGQNYSGQNYSGQNYSGQHYSGQPPGDPSRPGYASQLPLAGTAQPPTYSSYPAGQGPRRSGAARRTRGPNSFSWTAIGFAAGYLVLALTTNFVLLGIVPVFSSFRAFQRGEKLAPLAAVAAAITVGTAVYFIGFHHR